MDLQNLKILLEKLKLAEEVYNRAANKIHGDAMGDDIRKISSTHKNLFNSLVNKYKVDLNDLHIDMADRLKVSIAKLGMEIDDILIRLNQKEVFNYCLTRENEIVEAYKILMNNKSVSEEEKKYFSQLKNETESRIAHFKELINEYQSNYSN